MLEWTRHVPGFRSGSRWKQVLAVIGYFFIASALITGLGGNFGALFIGLEALVFVFLITNAWGLRSHIPGLNSTSKLKVTGVWAALFIVGFIGLTAALGANAPASKTLPAEPAVSTPLPTATSRAANAPVPISTETVSPTSMPTLTTIPTKQATTTPHLTATSVVPRVPIPSPTMIPQAGKIGVSANVSNTNPAQGSTVKIIGKLLKDGQGVAGATMHTVWNYKTSKATCDGGPTGSDGLASCERDIGRATTDYTVVVDVIFTFEGKQYSATTSFTPK